MIDDVTLAAAITSKLRPIASTPPGSGDEPTEAVA
jgi:hypothetical protein